MAVDGQKIRQIPYLRILYWLIALSLLAYLISVTFNLIRLLYVATLGWSLLTGGVYLFRLARRRPWIRIVTAVILLPFMLYLAAAGTPPDRDALRQAYLWRLRSFERVLYVWGGETHVGIDCSGLARMALCEAMVSAGVQTRNPRLLGPLLWRCWWQDLSAGAIGEGYRDSTVPVGHAPRLAGFAAPWLQPGDLAVSHNRTHVLIYLGRRQWIEANPEDGCVVIHTAAHDSTRGYFNMPMEVVRWTLLAE